MTWLTNQHINSFRPVFNDTHVCVTGGAGFIGGHLIDALIDLGTRITVIDDLSNSDASQIASQIEANPEQIRFIQGSILDPIALADAVQNAKFVFHLAALGSVPKSVEDPARTWVVNATGTMRVLTAAQKANATRVIYSASSSAYGDNPTLPKQESQAPEPESPYAAAKLAGESLCRSWANCYGIDTACLRYFNIFGPRQAADSAYAAVVPAFLNCYLNNQSPTIFGDGGQTRDFTHVTNAVYANLIAATKDSPIKGEVFNIGAGQKTSINQLATSLKNILNIQGLDSIYEPERIGEVRDSVADISKGTSAIGYQPVTALEDGLKSTAHWYRDHHQAIQSQQ
ncbi:MAG: NAD-dependent epimerase/dehydratase family protein [Phycisphaerales bacterium]|nr:NAD-dependent epimerase/dehydratase family protein [Phycisphaerales bacterium]